LFYFLLLLLLVEVTAGRDILPGM